MELIKRVIKETFEQDYFVKIASDGFDLVAKPNKGFAFVVGFVSYPGAKIIRDKLMVMKRFNEVEKMLVPILKKHNIHYRSYGNYHATIQTIIPFNQISGVSERFLEFIETRSEIPISLVDEPAPTNQEDIARFVFSEIQKSINYAKLTFIDKYQTLEDVYKESKLMNEMEIVDFYPSPTSLRQWVVNDFYEKEFNIKSAIEKQLENAKNAGEPYSDTFASFDKAALDLYHVLQQMKQNQ